MTEERQDVAVSKAATEAANAILLTPPSKMKSDAVVRLIEEAIESVLESRNSPAESVARKIASVAVGLTVTATTSFAVGEHHAETRETSSVVLSDVRQNPFDTLLDLSDDVKIDSDKGGVFAMFTVDGYKVRAPIDLDVMTRFLRRGKEAGA
jgi:hypothetical protein